MDQMIPRIHFYADLANHLYYFEKPDFESEIAKKFEKKVLGDKQQALEILTTLHEELLKLDDKFKKEDVHKVCSMYLYNQSQAGIHLKNQDVYFLLRYVVTGNYVGWPIGETWEVIGKSESLSRIEDMIMKLQKQLNK